jgi:small subunit ribosomal protein S3
MGQKVNPIGFRLAINRDWRSRWFASKKEMPEFLLSDVKIRSYVKKKLQLAAVSKVVIERAWNSLRVTIHTARPGIVIGRKGAEIEKMTEDISKMSGGKQVKIDIVEIKTPELDAQLVAENVALQIERRISFRRAMKKAVQTTMDFGARGIKIRSSGRLGGAEISRAEWYREGKIPLQTLRQPIDYGFAEAMTVYGKIGIKCWVCHPEEGAPERERPERPERPRRDRPGGGNRRGPGGPGGSGGPRGAHQPQPEAAPAAAEAAPAPAESPAENAEPASA